MSEKVKYQGRIVEVVEFSSPDGNKTYEKARRSPGVRLIIPLNNNALLLTKEYRHEIDDYDFRLPGGKVFDSLVEYNDFLMSGEDIGEYANKKVLEEARQEVGLEVKHSDHLYTSVLGSTMEWDLMYYEIKDFLTGVQELEYGEDIEVVEVSCGEAQVMCLDGRISEERSALMLLRYLSKDYGLTIPRT